MVFLRILALRRTLSAFLKVCENNRPDSIFLQPSIPSERETTRKNIRVKLFSVSKIARTIWNDH